MIRNKLFILLFLGIFPFLVNDYINSEISNNIFLYWGFELISWVLIPFSIFYMAFKKCNLKWQDIGISSTIFGRKGILLIVLVSLILAPIDYIFYREIYLFFYNLLPSNSVFSYQTIIPNEGIMRIIVLLYFSLSAGIVEELYRGFTYKISTYFSNPSIIFLLISPVVFALPHWESGIANFCATYIFGIFFGLLFLWFRNLWPLIIGHIFTDFFWFNFTS